MCSSDLISGTPTTSGAYNFTITSTDSASYTTTNTYSGTITPGVFSINYPVNLGGPYDTGTAIAPITFTTLNGISPVSYSYTGSLPSGITLSSSGVLSGTPNSVGTYNISVTATDSWSTPRTDTKSYSITTAAPGPLITLTSGDTFLNGETLTFTITGCSPDEYFDIYYGDGTSSHLQFSPAGTYGGSLLINTTAGQHTLSVSPVSGPTPASVNYYVNL